MEETVTSKTVDTYYVEICVGLRVGYGEEIHDVSELTAEVEDWLKENKDCVTVTPTTFYYVGGSEPGAIVRLINYPRFPRRPYELKMNAFSLAERLMKAMGQIRVSMITPTETIMFSSDPNDSK